ncbi:hypothetical protein [Yersinia thracica]|nr:hypothetical protein [Yersinia thracica]
MVMAIPASYVCSIIITAVVFAVSAKVKNILEDNIQGNKKGYKPCGL